MTTVVPGWTMTPDAVRDLIEFDISRELLRDLISDPVDTTSMDHGRLKYRRDGISAVVNPAMKVIITIGSKDPVDYHTRKRRLEDALVAEELARYEMETNPAPNGHRAARHGGRRHRTASPVTVTRMERSDDLPSESPRSFAQHSPEAWAKYWNEFYRQRGWI